jgi:Helicase C-terminal domain
MSLNEDEATQLRETLMMHVPRSVVLVPSDRARAKVAADAENHLSLQVFDAATIEESKQAFVTSSGAVAVFANRYDGIDFPGDECRLLFIDGLPKTTNAQERFLVSRMGAGTLLRGRIQTRVVQAVGRCTRSLQDYSAVVITGSEMTDYLNNPSRRRYFHPELQAELEFGTLQSTGTPLEELVENFDIFLQNDSAWESVNKQILAKRGTAIQLRHPGIAELSAVVSSEIEFQRRLWQGTMRRR